MLNIVTKEMSEVIVTNNKLLTIRDLIHDYFTNYNSPLPSSSGFTMWSEMNEIKYYYNENLKGISGCYPIEEIVRMCVRGLYTTGHQKRVPVTAINDAVNKLIKSGDLNENPIILQEGKDHYLIKISFIKNLLILKNSMKLSNN